MTINQYNNATQYRELVNAPMGNMQRHTHTSTHRLTQIDSCTHMYTHCIWNIMRLNYTHLLSMCSALMYVSNTCVHNNALLLGHFHTIFHSFLSSSSAPFLPAHLRIDGSHFFNYFPWQLDNTTCRFYQLPQLPLIFSVVSHKFTSVHFHTWLLYNYVFIYLFIGGWNIFTVVLF